MSKTLKVFNEYKNRSVRATKNLIKNISRSTQAKKK